MCEDYRRLRIGCLECAAEGHVDAFADLYDATVADVHRLSLLICRGDGERAAALVRSTYAEVWRTRGDFRASEHRALTWVLGATSALAGAAAGPGPRGGRAA